MLEQHASNPSAAAMIEMLRGFPAQCTEAVGIGRAFDPGRHEVSNIVMTGLGGSAIGADLLRAYVASTASVPVIVNRDYELPACVGEKTLVVAISYSGNTEETLAAWADARARGAQIVTFTTGGTLASESEAAGAPCCKVPGGLQPRAALGYSFFPLLITLEKLGIVPPQSTAIEDALRVIRQATDMYSKEDDNPAWRLAERLERRVPLIYGSWNAVGVVAYRWKSQINENAKGIAFWNTFPELNHNETVGWSGPKELCRDLGVVLLRTPSDPPRIRRRMDLTRGQIEAQAPVDEVTADGTSFLAQLFSLVVLGDWMSLYLALRRQQDPVQVHAIDAIKKALAEG